MRRVLFVFLLAINISAITVCAISAKSAVLIDGASGRVLYEHNAYEKMPMASTTKIMTGLLACESGKLGEPVKASAFASGTEGSSLWLKIGEKLTLEELTYGLMLKSGNDAAVAIAEHLGGSADAFALLMNKKAMGIGAVNTNFKNPHGLDAEGHYTTAFDLALIAREAMKNEKFREIVSTKTYSIPMQGENWDRALKNHNKLLWQYEGCNGIKTGFTKKCGRCLVSSAEQDGMRLICVTLNAPDDWNDHKYMLDYGFSNYKLKTVAKQDDKVTEVTYDKKHQRKVKIIYKDDYSVMVGDKDIITTQIELKNIKAPLEKGGSAGVLKVYCNGEMIAQRELVTESDIKEMTLWEKIAFKIKKIVFKLIPIEKTGS